MTYTIHAVDRALVLLELLAEERELGVTDIAERTGQTKSLVFRLLYTLEQRGYVHKDPVRRTYALGYRPLYLAHQAGHHSQLISTAETHLDHLAEVTQENVLLLVREELSSVCIAMRQSPQPLRLFAEIGKAVPLHAGGGPKVLLAYAPNAVRDAVLASDLQGFTATSIQDPAKLEQTLDRICRDGWTISLGELDPSAFSIAAPIRDHTNSVVAALSIAGPMSRLDDHRRSLYRDQLLGAASTLSQALGYRERLSRSA